MRSSYIAGTVAYGTVRYSSKWVRHTLKRVRERERETNYRTELAMVMKWPKARYNQSGLFYGNTLFMLIISNCLEKLRNLNDSPLEPTWACHTYE